MEQKHVQRDYSNGEVTIHWDSAKCIHSGNCVRNLSQVFRPREQPWIQPENATSAEIREAVSKCPSGAISIKDNE